MGAKVEQAQEDRYEPQGVREERQGEEHNYITLSVCTGHTVCMQVKQSGQSD